MGGVGGGYKVSDIGMAGNIFCIPDFENVSPGDWLDWVKQTHCAVKTEWKFIFFGFMIFYFLFCFLLYFMCSISLELPSDGDFLGSLLLAW